MKLKNLQTKYIGKNLIYYKTIDSTQSQMWKISTTAPSGTLIIAEKQTNGKGTHDRKWYTDESNNIAFSLLLKPEIKVKQLEGLTVKIAEIIVQVIKNLYKIELEIKEPNDIIYKNKKIGGILTQTKLLGEKIKCLVIGIGINTNQTNFTQEIKETATSLKKEFNIQVDNQELITEFCNKFEQIWEDWGRVLKHTTTNK